MVPLKEEHFLIYDAQLPFTAFVNNGIDAPVHWHNYIELLYVISGQAVITVDSEKYPIFPNDFLIVNAHEVHNAKFSKDIPTEVLVIQFETNVLNPNLGSLFESKYVIPFLQKEVMYSKCLQLEEESSVKALLTEILEEFGSKKPGYEFNVKGNIYKVFSWLIRCKHINFKRDSSFNTPELLRFKPLFEYIESNYSKEISNETAAEMVYLSYHHFCRLFKKVTGKTFIEYLNFVRLSEAEKLLISTSKSISQIANEVGLNVSYFNRIFRKAKGLSPLLYKKQNSIRKEHNG